MSVYYILTVRAKGHSEYIWGEQWNKSLKIPFPHIIIEKPYGIKDSIELRIKSMFAF